MSWGRQFGYDALASIGHSMLYFRHLLFSREFSKPITFRRMAYVDVE